MPTEKAAVVDIDPGLIEAIATFPTSREVAHCRAVFRVSPFDIYATCPECGRRLKIRSFAAVPELEDVFDAVFAWMAQPGAAELVGRRQQELAADAD